jgi:sugar (pentulose or hexulose) kinase
MASNLLGVDIGTSLIKAVVFDPDGLELAAGECKVAVASPQRGWAEQDMDAVWTGAGEAIRAAVAALAHGAASIAAVGVTGQGDGAWMIDAVGRPVGPAPLWSDGRAHDIIERWASEGVLHAAFGTNGTVLWPGSQASLLAWLETFEPERIERMATVFCAKDWVRYRLTGEIATDVTDGSIPFMDLATRSYDDAQLERLGLAHLRDRLPPVLAPHDIAGVVTRAAAEATGLVAGTKVVAGMLDGPASALGVGAVAAGQAMTILGTTALVGLVLGEAVFEPEDVGATVCHAPDRRWLRVLGTMAGTPNLDWYLRTIGRSYGVEAVDLDQSVYGLLEASILASPPGAGGVVFHPFLLGERAPFLDPGARGGLFGLTADTTRDDITRAVYEGVSFAIRHCFDAINARVDEVRLSGGGARSGIWSQMLADVTGSVMTVPAGSQFGAQGAAIAAGVGIGTYGSYEEAVKRCVRVERRYEPDPTSRRVYDERFAVYRDLIGGLRPYWPRLR